MTSRKKQWILYTAIIVYMLILSVTGINFFNSFSVDTTHDDNAYVSLTNTPQSSSQSLIYDLIGEKKEKEPVIEEILSEGTNHQDVIGSSKKNQQIASESLVTFTKNASTNAIDTAHYFSAPTGGGDIAKEHVIRLIIPQNTKVSAMLTENLSNLQNHVVHAIIQEDLTIDGKYYPLKGATLIGAVSTDDYLERFNINFVKLFLKDNQSKQGIDVTGVAIDSQGERGLVADQVNKKRVEKILNGITTTVKGIVSGATTGQLQGLASAGSSAIDSYYISKELFLKRKRINVIFDFPIEIIGGL